jgi:hypothetical protein
MERLPDNIIEAIDSKFGLAKFSLPKKSLIKINKDGKFGEKDLNTLDSNAKEFYFQWKKMADNSGNPGGVCFSCFTILKKGARVNLFFFFTISNKYL